MSRIANPGRNFHLLGPQPEPTPPPPRTRCKFVCERVVDDEAREGKVIELRAVSDGSPENEAFFGLTPSASCYMAVVNPDAAETFEPGASYYVDFTRAPE